MAWRAARGVRALAWDGVRSTAWHGVRAVGYAERCAWNDARGMVRVAWCAWNGMAAARSERAQPLGAQALTWVQTGVRPGVAAAR